MDPGVTFGILWTVFFLHGMTPGLWLPALTNILGARGLGGVGAGGVRGAAGVRVDLAAGGRRAGGSADGGGPAVRLVLADLLRCCLFAAFRALAAGWHPAWFVALLGCYSLVSGPSWGVLATVSLTHLSHGERQFPLVRVGATIGWIAGGLITSFVLRADTSPVAGYASAGVRLLAGLAAFLLPRTPPLGLPGTTLGARLGLDAFSLMKQRDHLVFFVVTALFSIPLSAFYMYGPEFLKVLGDAHPTGTMTVAQVLEVLGMLALGSVMTRCRVKTVLSWALGLVGRCDMR